MHPLQEQQLLLTRRNFFGSSGIRLGGLALWMLAARSGRAEDTQAAIPRSYPPLPGLPHFPPKAEHLIYLHMNGGPAQMDLWDYKPELAAFFDKDLPDSIRMGQRITTMTSGQTRLPVAPSKFKFAQHGQCGMWVSELLPYTAKCVDDIALVKTVHTNAINHDPACTSVMTGSEVPGKPSIGSWLAYGLGSESNDLPAFVVLTPNWKSGAAAQALFTRMWSSGFLASKYTGVVLRHVGDPVLYVQNPPGVTAANRRAMLDTLQELNHRTVDRYGDPETLTRIAQYEMAFRMQTSVPELTDRPERIAGDARSVRARCQQAGHLCGERTAGATACRTGRACRSDPASRLGPAWDLAARPHRPVPGYRPADGGPADGSQTTRPAGENRCGLGGRIRSHGLLPGYSDGRGLRPRSPPAQFLHVAGRGRRQRRPGVRRDG